jgi:acetylornithine/N-succinyldiaminopimelate aminotransferase
VFLDALDDGLLEHVREVSAHLVSGLHALAARHGARIAAVRGAGLIAGLDLTADAQPVVEAALDRGLLVNRTASTVVRLLPPYIVTTDEIDEALRLLEDAIVAGGSDSARRPA